MEHRIELDYRKLLEAAVRAGNSAEQQIALHHNIGGVIIDEVAILFYTQTEAKFFVREVRRFGWELFNEAHDEVSDATKAHDNPSADHYEVAYWFLKHEDLPGIRIEVMCILQGRATLHDQVDNGGVVHASWKCKGVEHYEATVKILRDLHVPCQRRYRSTYGLFSYWGEAGRFPLFKPRLNLRDGG